MKKLGFIIGVFALLATATVVSADPVPAGVHFKNPQPTCSFNGDFTSVDCEGIIVGLGGHSVAIFLDAPADIEFTCTNPANQDNPSKTTSTDTIEGAVLLTNTSNNQFFEVSADTPDEGGRCKRNWNLDFSATFTGEWTITVCAHNEEVLSAQSSAAAPAPECG